MEQLPFSALTNAWFRSQFSRATEIQRAAWPLVQSGQNCLISAGTGQGKTLAAFLPLIDRLLDEPRTGSVLYIAPLKALSKNMAEGLTACISSLGDFGARRLKIGLRTGDTSPAERRRQMRSPAELLLTTPESLFVLLGSQAGRRALLETSVVIVDEVHALAAGKRGAHLSLSLERLQALRGAVELQRIGLSATARPRQRITRFLSGGDRACRVAEVSTATGMQVVLELPKQPLGDVAGQTLWSEVTARIAELIVGEGRGLVFCNTRALVERVAAELSELIGAQRVAAHHGSLGMQQRCAVEQGLRNGDLDVVVCSSTLELGIDVGQLERVIQIGSVDSVSTARQRAGRSRHRPGQVPALHLFPLTISDLLAAHALLLALDKGRLEAVEKWHLPPCDVLCQQLVGMVAGTGMNMDEVRAVVARAAPFEQLSRESLDEVVSLLHDGYVPGRETGRGPVRRGAGGRLYPGHDAASDSRLNVGTIPEWFDYEVLDASSGQVLGHLDEEFAFESSPGQVFQLGGQAYCIERIRSGRVEVRAVESTQASLPFWTGDGAGRSRTLSMQLCRLFARAEYSGEGVPDDQAMSLLDQSRRVLGKLPGAGRVILERFPDPGGDEHLVIHAPFGLRINRAWGLALRKRFCRQFNFELQAVGTDNAVLISLGATHSFPLAEVIGYLHSSSIEHVLTQAVLDTPQFATRFRWCATTALAIQRRNEHGRISAQLQRNQAENLIARIFPDQLACLENLSGPREVPAHPLVIQALDECLNEFMDVRGLIRLYRRIESGRLIVHTVETKQPSPLARAVIHAPPSGFLDPAEAEERRTRTFEVTMSTSVRQKQTKHADPLAYLAHPEHLEEALQRYVYLPAVQAEKRGGLAAFRRLSMHRTAFSLSNIGSAGALWVHVDHLGLWLALNPGARIRPFLPTAMRPKCPEVGEALRRVVLGALRRSALVDISQLAAETGQAVSLINSALRGLQCEGLARSMDLDTTSVWSERSVIPAAATAASSHTT